LHLAGRPFGRRREWPQAPTLVIWGGLNKWVTILSVRLHPDYAHREMLE
jgi:hypothetical protein